MLYNESPEYVDHIVASLRRWKVYLYYSCEPSAFPSYPSDFPLSVNPISEL